jgi:hypothetical protein
MWLSPEQLKTLTKRIRPSAQARRLRALGIDFISDGDGSPLVLESVVQKKGGAAAERTKQSQEPNFGALRGTQA